MTRSTVQGPEMDHEAGSGANENLKDGPDSVTPKEAGTKSSKMAGIWRKLGLDLPTILMMMKAGLPPAIALAIYQSTEIAETFWIFGYLVAIIAILGICIMPRAKFIQTMMLNIIATCIAAAVCMLMVWSGVQARLHTTSGPPQRYNSSASAVNGIWLFFQVWLVNAIKAKYPQLMFPAVLYSVFANVAAGYGPTFLTVSQAEIFIQRILESFLTGFAIATGVSLVIIPVTSRTVAIKGITAYITVLRGTLQAHRNYLQGLETTDVFSKWKTVTMGDDALPQKPENRPEIEALKRLTSTITQLHSKVREDVLYAKREIAYGKMTPDDFEALFKHLREIMMPMVSLVSLVDLFDRAAETMHWNREPGADYPDPQSEALHRDAVNDWHGIMKTVHEPVASIIQAMDGGLEHVLLKLQLVKLSKKKKGAMASDEESKGDMVQPGDAGYAEYLERQIDNFYNGKETTLRQWVESKGFEVREDFYQTVGTDSFPKMEELTKEATHVRDENQRQLHLFLFVVFLLYSISCAIHRLAKFADEKDQANTKSKFIFPGKKRFRKWIASTFKAHDVNDDELALVNLSGDGTIVHMGAAYSPKKDPEHLPPENVWERFGNFVRGISRFLRSPESNFGFRVACATMTIAIVNFLHDTQRFFVDQRFVWALIMVAISMTPTSGQSVISYLFRILGTVIAMITAWLIWYIPDQKTAGIIVFLWFFVSLGFYIPLKKPDLLIVGLIAVVTATLIVGYELEVRKLGIKSATSNGQPAYKIYLLGPYRLATVVGGLAVAFIWTFFPYPISEHSALRQKLGAALYLSANYYSVTHETVLVRIRGDEGNSTDTASPVHHLAKVRNKVFAKQMGLLEGLRNHSAFVRWEFLLGGKFPIKEYNNIIQLVANITNYTALLAYASETFTQPKFTEDPSQAQWFHDFRKIITSANLTSHEITSTLALLSSSITNGQPLPPYLTAPAAYRLAKKMEAIDRDILSIRHIAEPGYATFAVLQISTTCISMDLEKLLQAVKRLVGELDFSFRVVRTRANSDGDDDQSKQD